MPLIHIKIQETCINLDPLFFEWFTCTAEPTKEKQKNKSVYFINYK